MRAARWLGVAPWEMERRSVVYRSRALVSEEIEASEREKAHKRAQRKTGKGMH